MYKYTLSYSNAISLALLFAERVALPHHARPKIVQKQPRLPPNRNARNYPIIMLNDLLCGFESGFFWFAHPVNPTGVLILMPFRKKRVGQNNGCCYCPPCGIYPAEVRNRKLQIPQPRMVGALHGETTIAKNSSAAVQGSKRRCGFGSLWWR